MSSSWSEYSGAAGIGPHVNWPSSTELNSALIQAGLKIDTERGVSDEGDPWFAFCRRG